MMTRCVWRVSFQQINHMRKYRLRPDMQYCMHVTCTMVTGKVPLVPQTHSLHSPRHTPYEKYLEIILTEDLAPILLIPFILLNKIYLPNSP